MRLIEVAGIVNGVKNRDALLEQSRRVAGTFDLPDARVRHSGGLDEMTLPRAARTVGVVAVQRCDNRFVASDHSAMDETIDECLDVVEGGIVPLESVQTEPAADIRHLLVVSIDQGARRMLTQERPQREADTKPFTIRRTFSERGSRLWPAQRQKLTATNP